MKDEKFLREQFATLESQISEEDNKTLNVLQQEREREEANIATREDENNSLFTDLGFKEAPNALEGAMERARNRTENQIPVLRKDLEAVADPRLEDGKLISQVQAISRKAGKCPQSGLYHANVSHLIGGGETDGTKELDLGSINAWCWASGGGLWSSASYTVNADFWFIHYPSNYCYLHIHPYVVLHGYYINIADDEWWNSAYSRTRVDVQVRSYQYYWSGWTSTNVHNVGSANINRARRIDRSRHYYHHMNVGAEDPVWTLVRVRLYVYARAAGSYSRLDFSTGAANYIDVPHVDFFC